MPSQQVPLILHEEDVPWFKIGRRPPVRPGTAVVFSTNHGEVVSLGGRMDALTAAANTRFRIQYTVDMADHEHDLIVPGGQVACSDPLFMFGVTGHVGWRVKIPEEIVRRRVSDGRALVQSRVLDMIRDITVEYPMESINQAQAAVRNHFGRGDLDLPEGIRVYRCSPVLAPDPNYIGPRRQIDLKNLMDRVISGERDVLLLHLANNPDATQSVLEQLGAAQKASDDLKLELIKSMMEAGYLQNIDVDGLRDDTIRHLIATVRSTMATPNPMLSGSSAARVIDSGPPPTRPTPPTPPPPDHGRPAVTSQPDNVAGWRVPGQTGGRANGSADEP
jgi:hypothetical protein